MPLCVRLKMEDADHSDETNTLKNMRYSRGTLEQNAGINSPCCEKIIVP